MVILSGLPFLFRFLPVFFLVYAVCPAPWRDFVLLAGSLAFYATGEPVFIFLLAASVVVNIALGRLTWRAPGTLAGPAQHVGIVLAVAVNTAVLVMCKVLALTVDASLLPLGLSFYIFKMISYQADCFTGRIEKRPGVVRSAAYFTMFPQITQGPIMRYGEGFSGKYRHLSFAGFERGLQLAVIGLSFKVLLADRIGILWNEIIKIGFESISTPLAWLGAFAYSFQLYFDFWGYSLIAAGVGVMLGFPFIENFRDPYLANGIGDFYRRWHMTLGSWFRDYVYIPLGGSRCGAVRTILHLMIVWAMTGLWHGGTVNFLIWGIVLGLIIVWEKFAVGRLMKKTSVIGHIHVWLLIPLTWVIFAISDLKELGIYFTRLFPFFGEGVAVSRGDYLRFLSVYWPYFAICLALSATPLYRFIIRRRRSIPVMLLLIAAFWGSMYYLVTTQGNAFMYFSF